MNFKKTLGLVLTAALVSSSLVAVKPVKAATTSAPAVVATAPTSSLKGFSYFFAQKSLTFEGDTNSCVVSTAYTGKVQYEMWVKQVSDPSAKWQVVSKGADGKPGYTAAVDGQNSLYTIPLVDGFSFKQGNYILAVYAKVADTTGTKSYGLSVNDQGFEDKNGTLQKCDVATSAKLNVMSKTSKQKYNEMSGNFKFSSNTLTVGQKVTFQGFDTQKSGAKYKFIVRKSGTDGSDIKNYTFVNSSFSSTVDWTPAEAGTYEVIAWSAPEVNKGGARDGWYISTVTVNDASVAQKATVSTTVSSASFGATVSVTSDYKGAAKFQVLTADGKTQISAVAALGSKTTVYPAVKAGDTAVIALMDTNGATLKTVNVTLGTDVKVDQPTDPTPVTSTITGTVSKASFGATVLVSTDNKNATNFQVLTADGKTQISAKVAVGSKTTVYPAVQAGDKVTVQLFDASDKVLDTQVVTLK